MLQGLAEVHKSLEAPDPLGVDKFGPYWRFFATIPSTEVYRIIAWRDPSLKINMENKELNVFDAADGWQSAMWRFEWTEVSNVCRIVSAWDGHHDWKINMENEELGVSQAGDGRQSAKWSVEMVGVLGTWLIVTIQSAWE